MCIPLLILGWITSKFFPFDNHSLIVCQHNFCRNLGTDINNGLYKHAKSQSPSWFEVQVGDYDENAFPHDFISASTRIVRNAKIISASASGAYGPEVESFMGALAGQQAIVKLGASNDERSIIKNNFIKLSCNELIFKAQEGKYASTCYGDGWSGLVNYWVPSDSRSELDELLNSVNNKIDSRKSEYYLYMTVMLPAFVYAFFVVSFLIWLFVKAARFVKSG
ncbi:hypothetical protein Pnap_3933 [Polaromonas naphthalenivorans CJ2]|uniref:Uncharacterized protein n=1 Tax=Polaromonas naphthalenivorans (strain CJ2) TaxID=365044 RepID=A1VUA1_POLNA|nr:hypothetical protein Pnap_3933 [Polaromonas naphthalenivorans CJ2]